MKSIKYIIIFLFISVFSFSQTLEYEVFFMGKKVGVYIANVTNKDNHSTIKVYGNSTFTFIKKFSIIYKSESRFTNGHFVYSNSRKYNNGKRKDSVLVHRNRDNKFDIYSYESGESVINNIFFTGSLLYFSEPNNIKEIFAENKGYFVPISKIEEHTFVTIDKERNEKITYYYFKNVLVKAIIEKSIFTLEMKLIKYDKNKSTD